MSVDYWTELISMAGFLLLIYLLFFALVPFLGRKRLGVAPFILGGLGLLYQLIFHPRQPLSSLGIWVGPPELLWKGPLAVCGILMMIVLVGYFSRKLSFQLGRANMPSYRQLALITGNIFLSAVATILIATFTEELVFRGIVQRLLSQQFSPLLSIILSSLAFGIWHIPFGRIIGLGKLKGILYVVNASLLGFIIGLFYALSGSLILAGLLHGIWNTVMYVFWGLGDSEYAQSMLRSQDDTLTHPEYGLFGTIVIAGAAWIFYLSFVGSLGR